MNAGQTPLEAEFMAEISDATLRAGLNRQRAGDILLQLTETLKGRQPEPGKPILECYDLVNHRPLPEFAKIYQKLKEQLAALGLSFT